jgi:hypothetical protein
VSERFAPPGGSKSSQWDVCSSDRNATKSWKLRPTRSTDRSHHYVKLALGSIPTTPAACPVTSAEGPDRGRAKSGPNSPFNAKGHMANETLCGIVPEQASSVSARIRPGRRPLASGRGAADPRGALATVVLDGRFHAKQWSEQRLKGQRYRSASRWPSGPSSRVEWRFGCSFALRAACSRCLYAADRPIMSKSRIA